MPEEAISTLVHAIDLPKFNGDGCVISFLKHFQARVDVYTNDETLQCRYIKNALSGKAWDAYVLKADRLLTLKDVKDWLESEYKNTMNYRKAVHRILYSTFQEANERINTFVTSVLTSWRDVYGERWNYEDENAQYILIPVIVNNMNSNISSKLPHDFDPESVSKLLEKAKAIEESILEDRLNASRKRKVQETHAISEHETVHSQAHPPKRPPRPPFQSRWPPGAYDRSHYFRSGHNRPPHTARNGHGHQNVSALNHSSHNQKNGFGHRRNLFPP
jgi:hypothetical protein